MSTDLKIDSYRTWSTLEKLEFFDEEKYSLINNWDSQEIINFLKFFILTVDENKYIIKKSLSLFIDFALLEKIPSWQIFNLLINEIDDIQDTFIQIERLKGLVLFYELDPKTIIEIFKKNINHEEGEIQSESLYSLGLIYFLRANDASEENDFKEKISHSIAYFRKSYLCIENRMDSLFFLLVTELVKATRFTNSFQSDMHLNRISEVLWKYRLFSLDEKELYLKVKVYRIIFNLLKINREDPSNWLQFKDEFNNLCLTYYELKNSEIKHQLSQTTLIQSLKSSLIKDNLEPYFKLNFKAVETKIKVYLASSDITDDQKAFLNYILSLSGGIESNLIETISVTKQHILRAFPNAPRSLIDRILDTSSKESLQQNILKVLDELGKFTFEQLYEKLISALIQLQGNIFYKNTLEDNKNTQIRDLLVSSGIYIRDQTLGGSSNTGKSAGEIDLMVLDHNQLPFSIIEALVLDSLKKDYLALHINKVYKYDTTGLQNNIIIVYSEAKNFSNLCANYYTYIKIHKYPYELLSCDKIDCGYTEIKVYKSTLKRSGMPTNLYHIVINLAYA